MNFASMATNQSQYCMEKVCDMKFCYPEPEPELVYSDEMTNNKESKLYLEKPIAFFDWEVFPNVNMLCYKVEGGIIGEEGKKEVVKLINPTPNQVTEFFKNYRAIGFNNLEYDNYISYAVILGWGIEQIYELSKTLTSNDKALRDYTKKLKASLREAKKLSYTDIFDFSNTKQSLKVWEIECDLPHQECSPPRCRSGHPPHRPGQRRRPVLHHRSDREDVPLPAGE